MSLYKNKYRNETTRAKWWDYHDAAAYFVTICTKHRAHFFGEIANGEMHLNDIGRLVEHEWIQTSLIRMDMHLTMGEFVVMPDHFHGIIGIGKNPYNGFGGGPANKFGPQSKNLASIIRGFKSSVTMQARKINPKFGWQSLYHDRIVRDEEEYNRMTNYISLNPQNWR